MIFLSSPTIDKSNSACESICETVDRSYPHFSQSSGKLIPGNFYLLNSKKIHDFNTVNQCIVMRVDRLGKATKSVVGELGCTRFNSFLTYVEGWDGRNAKPLSLESVAMIDVFVSNFKEFATEPSLFMTRKGNLKLGWEDSTGAAIEVEFLPGSFKYYLERKDEEGSVRLHELNKLIKRIHSLDDAAATT